MYLDMVENKPMIFHKNSSVTTLDNLLVSKFYFFALTSLNNISQFFACYMKYSFLVILKIQYFCFVRQEEIFLFLIKNS